MNKFKNTKVAKVTTQRWKGQDMEAYFERKAKDFLTKLRK